MHRRQQIVLQCFQIGNMSIHQLYLTQNLVLKEFLIDGNLDGISGFGGLGICLEMIKQ